MFTSQLPPTLAATTSTTRYVRLGFVCEIGNALLVVILWGLDFKLHFITKKTVPANLCSAILSSAKQNYRKLQLWQKYSVQDNGTVSTSGAPVDKQSREV